MIKFQMNQKETAMIVFQRAVERIDVSGYAGSVQFLIPAKFEYPLRIIATEN